QTDLPVRRLPVVLRSIEDRLGRVRGEKWGPRTIDLDVILYGDAIVDEPDLHVPHREMHLRSFVLAGLCEIAGGLVHPVLGETVDELYQRLGGGDYAVDAARPQLVSVAGIIGVGKTTLAEGLSAAMGGVLLREPYDTNPFLAAVYDGNNDLALDSQLYFLAGRMEQLDRERLSAGVLAFTDYVFDKELIYARRLLDGRQLALYERIFPPVRAHMADPVLVIYLRDTVEGCLRRIHSRNRPYEQRIEAGFLQALSEDYEGLFRDWRRCPVIRLNVPSFDGRDRDQLQRLAEQIKWYASSR
ncbi:MAG TPA: 2-amino-4-hydroxy-6-hydroxymethyldihydropteridine diphosphokinase, partial [Phycisphaerales bacterium]|nr:2-amino-4-hydroxy-6-hydroxymethyldihydropteridine diphosphokinase [Phycisphaerales bacterium]